MDTEIEEIISEKNTYLDENNYVYWNTNDAVLVNGEEYTFNEGVVKVKLANSYYAVYPATEANKNVTANGGTVVIPATQNYTEKDGHQVLGGPMVAFLISATS